MNFETERLRLRPITGEDLDLLVDLDSDPEVMSYLTDGRPLTLEEEKAALERCTDLFVRYKVFGLWIANLKSTGEFIGWFLFRPCKKFPEDVKTIELGYRLKKKFWGMGLAPEASRAFLDYGFNQLKINTVFATTMEKNTKSRRVMEKIGLKYKLTYVEDQFPGDDKSAVRYEMDSLLYGQP